VIRRWKRKCLPRKEEIILAKRVSCLTSPTMVEVIIIPDAERVAEATRRAAPSYRRALLKKLKSQKEAEKPSA
jgi:hypothetical protein